MSAKDLFHKAVKHALEKENWLITDDPLRLPFGLFNFYIDLGAEEMIAAEKEHRQIAIEIKSFTAASTINEFHANLYSKAWIQLINAIPALMRLCGKNLQKNTSKGVL